MIHSNYHKQAIDTLRERNYGNYERLMEMAINNLSSELRFMEDNLLLKKRELKMALIEVADIQKMLLNEEKANDYYDRAFKIGV